MSPAMRAAMLWLAMIGLAAADDMKVVSSVVVLNNDNFEHLTQASTGANGFPFIEFAQGVCIAWA